MKKILFTLLFIASTIGFAFAQSYAFGLKGGPTIGTQQWDGFDRQPLFSYHGVAFIESAPEDNSFALFAQSGYHVKGSSIGGNLGINPTTGNPFRFSSQGFEFHNIDLVLGAKQKFDKDFFGNSKAYYLFGVRGDYTISTNLDEYQQVNSIYFPIPQFVRKWNYGATVGGGFEVPLSDFVAGILELNIHPDFSNQYMQGAIPNVRNPFTGQLSTVPERTIRNLTFEISLGFRFLHKIEYID